MGKYGMNPEGKDFSEKLGVSVERTHEIRDNALQLVMEHAAGPKGSLIPIFEGLLDRYQGVELVMASMSAATAIDSMMNPRQSTAADMLKSAMMAAVNLPHNDSQNHNR